MRREIIETLVFLTIIISYIIFKEYIAGKAIFIVPAILLCAGYAAYSFVKDSKIHKEFGIRFDNIGPASKLTALLFVPFAVIIVVISIKMGASPPPPSFYYLLLLYPFWGISQQFIFQSFFHTRLIRLGLKPWSVIVVAMVFAAVHLPSTKLVFLTLTGGLLASYIFMRYPNIIPLGVAHGILAAMIYYLVLNKDVLKNFA